MKSHRTPRALAAVSKFKFRKSDTIGNTAAESDSAFLVKCFVNTEGDLDRVRDCSDERGIVLGRTGTGKTALLRMLKHYEERTVAIDPHVIALGYISNSPVLTFFESLGIKMDLFYRALWRHVFVVAVLQKRLDFQPDQDRKVPWEWLRSQFQAHVLRRRAFLDGIEYLEKRSTEFWNTTEELIKEITVTAETELKSAVEVGLHQFLALGAEGVNRLSTEQRVLLHQLGQDVVNRIQMSKLDALFHALDEVLLKDPQKRYFIVVDKLDEDWVDDPVRYRLIRALIETMREFNSKVRHGKAIIALRTDLFDRVLRATTDSGFQGEKYRSLCLPLRWTGKALVDVLETRINQLIENRYSGRERVSSSDILPKSMGRSRQAALEYILERTLMRPRDAIAFFNACVEEAEGTPEIKPQHIYDAEVRYSRDRIKSLADEWSVQYPYIGMLAGLLAEQPSQLKLADISSDGLADLAVSIVGMTNPRGGDDYRYLQQYVDGKMDSEALRRRIALILYRVGMVGLKIEPHLSEAWAGDTYGHVSVGDITDSTCLSVHKTFWRALGIRPSKRDEALL